MSGDAEVRILALERKLRVADWRMGQVESVAAGAAEKLNQAWVLPSGCNAALFVYAVDQFGNPVSGATVDVLTSSGVLLQSSQTDGTGSTNFLFSTAQTGLTVEVSTLAAGTVTQTGVSVPCAANTTLHFHLIDPTQPYFNGCSQHIGTSGTVSDSYYGNCPITWNVTTQQFEGCKVVTFSGTGLCPGTVTFALHYAMAPDLSLSLSWKGNTQSCPVVSTCTDPVNSGTRLVNQFGQSICPPYTFLDSSQPFVGTLPYPSAAAFPIRYRVTFP